MTFKDLINRHTWPGVKYRFLETYPDETDCIDAYADVYERLILLTPVETSMRLSVTEKVGDDGRIWGLEKCREKKSHGIFSIVFL